MPSDEFYGYDSLRGGRDCGVLVPRDLVPSPKSWVKRDKCDHRGGKCDHRIFGRPVWDRLFSRRVRARLQNRRSRPPSIGTFHRPACGRLRRPSPHRGMRQPSRRKMRPSHFRPACLGPIIFSAGSSRGSKTPITTTVHRDLHRPACGRSGDHPAKSGAHPYRRPSVGPITL